MYKDYCKIACLLILVCFSTGSFTQSQLAFPGAEGYGKYTIGGRGGKVYEVTNLNDSGEGSLRAAVEAAGPRTVVFRVSGTITLNSNLKISNPYITIAGQTAPGDGICLRRYPLIIAASQVIIRYIRVRVGDESGDDADAISSRYNKHIIVDHVSASWSIDETVSIYHCDSITVQWCLISESMYNSNHIKGNHGFGGIWGSNHGTYHHNLLAHHSSRNPRFASGSGNTDYRNNVVYNWGINSTYGGEAQQVGNDKFNFSNINMVANYYKPGPATRPGGLTHRITNPSTRNGAADYGKWYVADNFMYGNAAVTADNWNGGVQPQGGDSDRATLKLSEPWPAMPIEQQSAEEAYAAVLKHAGATLPRRDPLDARIVDEVRHGYTTFEGTAYKKDQAMADDSKKSGIIDSQSDVGGWPELKSLVAPTDSDHDGIPDDWEKQHGLDPNNAADSRQLDEDGFTLLEKYLNSLVSIGRINLTTPTPPEKNRVIILTDIEADPDDTQSLVRLFLYANQIDLKGLIATTSCWYYSRVNPGSIQKIIDAYGKIHPNLLKHEPGFPDAAALSTLVKSGLPLYGMKGVGDGMDSEGSEWIIKVLEEEDDRPLWISVWGGVNTLAQSLHTIKETKSEEEAKRLISKLRVYTISDQDDSGIWIRNNFPDLFYIVSPGDDYGSATWTGINSFVRGIDNATISNDWIAENIQQDHGPLGASYPDVAWGVEGDTPAFLSLIPNGLSVPEHPEWGGWGGRYELYKPDFAKTKEGGSIVTIAPETRPIWTNAYDNYTPYIPKAYGRTVKEDTVSFHDYKATLWRWRDDFQNDFAARMDWCLKSYEEANHPPVPVLTHREQITVKSGSGFTLDAFESFDPDGDNLSFLWFNYPEAGTYKKPIKINGAENVHVAYFTAPEVDKEETLHFILKVTDKGAPALSRYKRVIVKVQPN